MLHIVTLWRCSFTRRYEPGKPLNNQLLERKAVCSQIHHPSVLPELGGRAPTLRHHKPPFLPDRAQLAGGGAEPRLAAQHRLPAGGTQVRPGGPAAGEPAGGREAGGDLRDALRGDVSAGRHQRGAGVRGNFPE